MGEKSVTKSTQVKWESVIQSSFVGHVLYQLAEIPPHSNHPSNETTYQVQLTQVDRSFEDLNLFSALNSTTEDDDNNDNNDNNNNRNHQFNHLSQQSQVSTALQKAIDEMNAKKVDLVDEYVRLLNASGEMNEHIENSCIANLINEFLVSI